MIVTYLNNEQVVSIIEGFPKAWEENNQLLIEGGICPLLNDLTKASWGYYADKRIQRQYDEDGMELPLYLSDLDLSPMTAADLPRSMHIAALTAVDTVNKKGTVVRKWLGENYTYDNCYVSLQALEAYQAGKIKLFNNAFGILAPQNADSFVLVYFVSENPYDESLEIPVIVDKLVK